MTGVMLALQLTTQVFTGVSFWQPLVSGLARVLFVFGYLCSLLGFVGISSPFYDRALCIACLGSVQAFWLLWNCWPRLLDRGTPTKVHSSVVHSDAVMQPLPDHLDVRLNTLVLPQRLLDQAWPPAQVFSAQRHLVARRGAKSAAVSLASQSSWHGRLLFRSMLLLLLLIGSRAAPDSDPPIPDWMAASLTPFREPPKLLLQLTLLPANRW